MACNFLIETNTLQGAMSLANKILPRGIDKRKILVEIRNKEAVIKAEDSNYWLGLTIPLEKVTLPGTFDTASEAFAKGVLTRPYLGKYILLDIGDVIKAKFNLMLSPTSIVPGELKISAVGDLEKFSNKNKPPLVKITHRFPLQVFSKALKYLNFKPIFIVEGEDEDSFDKKDTEESKKRFVRILIKNKQALFMAIDDRRRILYETKSRSSEDLEDMDVTFEFSPLKKVLSAVKGKYIGFGYTKKMIRVYVDNNIDFYFPRVKGKVKNVKQLIGKYTKEGRVKPKVTFKVDAKDLIKGIKSLKSIVNHDCNDSFNIDIHLIKNENKDIIKLEATYNTIVPIPYYLSAYDLSSSYLIYVTDRLLDIVLMMDGLIQIDYYQKFLIVRSLYYNLHLIILPM